MTRVNHKKQLILVLPRFKYPSGDIPWGLVTLATVVKSELSDINISLIDVGFNRNMNFIEKEFRGKLPGIVGIYMDSIMFEDAIKIAKIAKKYKGEVIVGGPHPTLFPEAVISNDCVDAVCIGEGEKVLTQYVKSYYDRADYREIKGIWFKQNKGVIKNSKQSPLENLDAIPRLDLELLEIEKYIKNCIYIDSYNPKLRTITVMASRGCRFNCTYCQPIIDNIFGKNLRICSPEKMVDNLIYWKDKYNLHAFYFEDDNLTMFNSWLRKFCETIIEKKLNMVWACNSRVDTVDLELLELLRNARCIKIRFGIESASDRILNHIYNKEITIDMVRESINMTKKKGFQVSGYFMLGGPTETEQEIKNTIDFSSRSGLDEAVFTIFSPIPGTYLYTRALSEKWVLPEKYKDFDYYKASRPKLLSGDIPGTKLSLYKKMAYIKFYCHPKRITRTAIIVLNNLYKTLNKLKTYFFS